MEAGTRPDTHLAEDTADVAVVEAVVVWLRSLAAEGYHSPGTAAAAAADHTHLRLHPAGHILLPAADTDHNAPLTLPLHHRATEAAAQATHNPAHHTHHTSAEAAHTLPDSTAVAVAKYTSLAAPDSSKSATGTAEAEEAILLKPDVAAVVPADAAVAAGPLHTRAGRTKCCAEEQHRRMARC